jgi:Protein of unknown function (DUF4031)
MSETEQRIMQSALRRSLTILPERKREPVYVDRPAWPYRGDIYCHMFSYDLDELHAMADAIGLKREWFQEPPAKGWPHYDVGRNKRRQAVKLGAIEVEWETTLTVAAWHREGMPEMLK